MKFGTNRRSFQISRKIVIRKCSWSLRILPNIRLLWRNTIRLFLGQTKSRQLREGQEAPF